MPRPRSIDRDTILRAALVIADQDGIAAVSMHAVARSLAVTPMALYRHVDGKESLLDGLVELLLNKIGAQIGTQENAGGMPAALRQFAAAARHVALLHPEAFLLLLSRPAATEAAREVRGRLHDILRAGGVPEAHVAPLERILATTILGMAAGHATSRFAAAANDDDFAATLQFVEGGLARFLSA